MKTNKTPLLTLLNTPKERLFLFIATGGGSGLLKPMPGTWGSLMSLPFLFLTKDSSILSRSLIWFFLFILGTLSIYIVQKKLINKDLPEIVIDEILGMLLIFLFLPFTLHYFIAAFIIFRFFDILKIPPVKQVDQLSKKSSNLWIQSSGVILDDLLAALQSIGIIWLIQKIFPTLLS